MIKRVFVYGTLKKHHGNHGVLENSTFVGTAITCEDSFFMYTGGFPYVVTGGHFHIKGELYEVHDQHVANNLDRLEGYPGHYDRIPVTVRLEDSKDCIDCEMYVASVSTAKHIARRRPVLPDDHNTLEW